MSLVVEDANGTERAVHKIGYGTRLFADEGDKVKRGMRLAEWDPYTRPIMTEATGHIEYEDLVDGLSVAEQTDEFDRHHQPGGGRYQGQCPWRAPQAGDRDQGWQGQADQARPRHRRPLHAAGQRHSVG